MNTQNNPLVLCHHLHKIASYLKKKNEEERWMRQEEEETKIKLN